MTKLKSGAAARVEKINEISMYLLMHPGLKASDIVLDISLEYGVTAIKALDYYERARRLNDNRRAQKINPHFADAINQDSLNADFKIVVDTATEILPIPHALPKGLSLPKGAALRKQIAAAPRVEQEKPEIWVNTEARKRKPRTRVEVQKDLTLEPVKEKVRSKKVKPEKESEKETRKRVK